MFAAFRLGWLEVPDRYLRSEPPRPLESRSVDSLIDQIAKATASYVAAETERAISINEKVLYEEGVRRASEKLKGKYARVLKID